MWMVYGCRKSLFGGGIEVKFSEVDNCNTCKNAYDIDIQGDHCFCIANQCYMCANNRKECKDYVRGDVPAGKERWGHLEY